MTHQEIVDRHDGVLRQCSEEHRRANTIAIESRDRLRTECGAIGHVFANDEDLLSFVAAHRRCRICGVHAPAPKAQESTNG